MAMSIGTSGMKPVAIADDQWLEKHAIIVGPTGSGKSKLAESVIFQLILQGKGVTVIDVDDKTSDDLISRCAEHWDSLSPLLRHNLVYVKFTDDIACGLDLSSVAGLGKTYDRNLHDRVRQVNSAVAKSANLENLKDQQRRQRVMTNLAYMVLVRRDDGTSIGLHRILEVLDAWGSRQFERLFNTVNDNLPVAIARDLWRIQQKNKRDLENLVESTRNIWTNILGSPIVSQVVSNKYPALDVEKNVLTGASQFISLDQKDREASDVLASLITTLVMDAAWYSPTPHYIFIEEAHSLLGPYMEFLWSRGRKHGVGTCMLFPSLDSLVTDKWDLRKAALSIPRTKIFFQQSVDLNEIAEFVATPSLDFTEKERPVQLQDGYKCVTTTSKGSTDQEGYMVQESKQTGGGQGGAITEVESGGTNWQKQKGVGRDEAVTEAEGTQESLSEGSGVSRDSEDRKTTNENTTIASGTNQSHSTKTGKSVNFSSGVGGNSGWSNSSAYNWVNNFTNGFTSGQSGSKSKTLTINETYLAQFKTLWFKEGLETSLEVQLAKWKKRLRTLDTAEFILCLENLPALIVKAHRIDDPFHERPKWGAYQTEQLKRAIWDSKPCFFVPQEIEKWTTKKKSSNNATSPKRWEC